MPNLSVGDLSRLRNWRIWLLIVTFLVQGLQYALRPDYPYTSRAYTPLRPWGHAGWVAFGVLLTGVALWLALAPHRLRLLGFGVGAAMYLLLFYAAVQTGLVSGPLLLPAGLCLGEIRVQASHRGERER